MLATAVSQPPYAHGSWTGHSPAEEAKPSAATTLLLAFLAGTGGYADSRYWQQRQEIGYLPIVIHVHGYPEETPQQGVGTPATQLSLVREVFKPAMTDLATVFNVTRQTLYNWTNGDKQPSLEHAARLSDLALAAQRLADAGFSGSIIGRRKISEGKTLLQVAQEGGAAAKAADKLITTLRKEADQRARMTARLAGRKPATTLTEDAGSPMLHERA